MYGNYGNDEIHGTDESNHLTGDPGNDTFYGYGGDDYLESGEGHDIVVDLHPEESLV